MGDQPTPGGEQAADDKPTAGASSASGITPIAPPATVASPPARRAVAEEDGPEDTSGRPPLAEVAAERAAATNARVVDTDAEED